MLTRRPLVALATLILVPAALAAQTRRARPAEPPAVRRPEFGASPTELLNRRRELDLTPRQVARLDSLERTIFARRRTLMDQARALRDSTCGAGDRCSDSARRTLRDRMAQLRARGIDTTMGRQALAILDSTQRGRVQGLRMARLRQGMALRRDAMRGRAFGPPRGSGRGRMDAGPGRGRLPAEDRWMPRGEGRMTPRFRRGDDPVGPRRPMAPQFRRGDDPLDPRRPLPPLRRRGDDLDSLSRPDTLG